MRTARVATTGGQRWLRIIAIPLLILSGFISTSVGVLTSTHAAGNQAPTASPINTTPQEVPSLRTRTSRTFVLPSGIYQAQVYPGSINYQDASAAWQPIDNTLMPATTAGYAYQNTANRYTVLFPSNLSEGPIRVQTPAGWVAFSLPGATGAGTVSGATDTFTLPDATIAFTAGNDELKETMTLDGPTSPSSFAWTVQTSSGLSAQQDAAGGIDFVDTSGKFQFGFVPPFMQDQAGAVSNAVSLTLSQGATGQIVTVAANPAWLADSSRQWPVVLDPSVSFTPNPSCYISSGKPLNPSCTTATFADLGHYLLGDIRRALLQFNLSSIPGNSQVFNAKLGLDVTTPPSSTGTVELHQLTHSWTSPSWDYYNTATESRWATAGGDYNATAAATTSVGTTGGWSYWYPTQLVQGWVNGTIANDGLLLKLANDVSYTPNWFFTADNTGYSNSADWPSLTVSYGLGTGQQGFYTTVGQQLSDQMGLSVNVANGNLMLHQQGIDMPGIGLPLTLDPYFNNLLPSGGTTNIGNKWQYDLGGPGVGLTIFNDGSVAYAGPSGFDASFVPNGRGSYTSPPGIDATLVKNGDSTYSLTYHQSALVYNFNSSGLPTSVVDRSGNKLSYGYLGGTSLLSSITDTQGRTTTLSYNSSNLVSKVTDPAGRIYQYGYDSNNNLTSYTDPAGEVTKYAYTNGNLTQITDPANVVTTLAYDSGNRVTSMTQASGTAQAATWTYTYNSGNTVVTDPNKHAATYTYDAIGRVTAVKDPAGNTTQTTWTADNQVATVQEPSGATTTYSYDSNNNLTRIAYPTGAAQSWAYANGSFPYLPSSHTDAQGNTTTLGYNSQGLLTSSTNAQNHTTSALYNSNGTVQSTTDANTHTTSYSYYPSGADAGLLSQITPPSPLGSTSYTYNTGNLLATETDGKGQKQSYTYDGGTLSTGRVSGIAYDNANGTLAGSIGYSYDGDGNVLAMSDPTGTTTYTPNALNQITKQSYTPTGKSAETSTYAWDRAGNLLSKTDSGGTITYGYTSDDQVQTVTDRQNHVYTLGYDQNGNRTSIAFPNGVTEQMGYDSNDNLTRIWATKGGSTLTSFTYSYTNPSNNQPTLLPYSRTDVINTSVSGDNVNASWAYQYDPLNRLTSATETGTPRNSYSYGYDPASNLTSITTNGTQVTQSFNAANEMTQSGGTTYSYDANGNRTGTSAGQAFTYNALNQTSSITPPGGSAISAAYAGVGQAERTSFGQGTQQYDVTGMDILTFPTISITPGLPPPPPPGANDLTSTPDGLNLSDQTSSGTYYPLMDGSGTMVAATDLNGNVIETVTYAPNGTPVYVQVEPNVPSYPISVDGMMCDTQTGLCSTGATYYEPNTGQTTQPTPDPGNTIAGPGSVTEDVSIPGAACVYGGVILGPLCCYYVAHCFGLGSGGGPGRQLKLLTPGDIRLLKANDINPEQLKKEYGCDPPSRCDLYKDQQQWVYVAPKGNLDAAQQTWVNLRALPIRRPLGGDGPGASLESA